MPASETAKRVAVAAVAIPIVLGALFAGGWVLALLIGAFAVLAALELYRLTAAKGTRALTILGAGAAALFPLLAAVAPERGAGGAGLWGVLVGLALLAVAIAIWARGVDGDPLRAASVTVFGAVYTGGMLAYALFLRHLSPSAGAWGGTALVFAPVLLTWASDTFAYFVGRRWGRRKLIPRVSPGKTVEGAVGAILGTTLVAVGYTEILRQVAGYSLSIGEAVAFGVMISVAAQLGDLAESLLKRDAGVKDSGTLFPGHGGALDRMDSLLFALPLAYLFFRLFADRLA